jgi:hypothetical protein
MYLKKKQKKKTKRGVQNLLLTKILHTKSKLSSM